MYRHECNFFGPRTMARDHDKDQGRRHGSQARPALQGKGNCCALLIMKPPGLDRIHCEPELRGYWGKPAAGPRHSARADVEPQGIRALDYAFVLERIAPAAARFRLAGRHLIDLMGMEVRGMPVCSFMNDTSSRGGCRMWLEASFAARRSPRCGWNRPPPGGRSFRLQMLLLPLRSDLGDVTALGCLIAEGADRPEPAAST